MPTRPKGRLMVILLVLLSTVLAMCILLAGISSSLLFSNRVQKLQGLPTPVFVLTTVYHAQVPSGSVCTTISQETLWSPEYPYGDLTKSITDSLNATIDDLNLGKDAITFGQYNAIQYAFKDGQVVGTYGDWTEICLTTGYRLPGQHIANIRFKSLSGKEYSYSWAFQVNY